MEKIIDLRSDTVTQPTNKMRQLISQAEVGDDVYQEDPTVNRLEKYAAELLGKEAALLVVSGTMGNLTAMLSHTNPGEEVILEADAHIFHYEVGGVSRIAGLVPRLIPGRNGIFTVDQLKQAIRDQNIHYPKTTLMCLENTHNRSGGCVLPQGQIIELAEVARDAGLKLHLDGARIFNAAVAADKSVKELAKPFDSVMFCLSKGLASPIGSMLVGSREFIKKARKARKLLGGGMRHAGILAAAGLESLQVMTKRLAEDHRRAKQLANALKCIPGLNVVNDVQTNMIMLQITKSNFTAEDLAKKLMDYRIIAVGSKEDMRLVTHYQIDDEDIEWIIKAANDILQA